MSQKIMGALYVLLFFISTSCSRPGDVQRELSPLEKQGQIVYTTNCLSCHNSDPTRPGSLGPDIAGTPIEVISAKINGRALPASYIPKRQTHIMPPLPFLDKDVAAIHAYLNLFKK
jgi:mono/diheme cytochrome c family protein